MKYLLAILCAFLFFNYVHLLDDKVCDSQKEVIGNAFKNHNPISKFVFTNDTKTSVQVTWAGDNSGKIILVTTKEIHIIFTYADLSDIYFSDNNGKSFKRITENLPMKNVIVRKENGLQRHSLDHQNIFLICYDTVERSALLITKDGGEKWIKVDLNFILDKEIKFHPYEKSWMLTVNKARNLYKSIDGGLTWEFLKSDVLQYQWTTDKKYSQDIFIKTAKVLETSILERFFKMAIRKPPVMNLEKSTDAGKNWKVIKKNIFAFYLRDKFLYISELISGIRRRLMVSIDNGETFNKVYLPTIGSSQFFSILHIEEDSVYIHVDNADNRGDGILFTSDSDGQVFSQSLMNHFYPSSEVTSDFYKVESMRGTYIANQLNPDRSIHSLITFNRGAEWKQIRKPINETCHNKDKTDCYIQVTGTYSLMNNVPSSLPISTDTAIGIILVHGHLASSLKSSKSDVYITSDGGYNWIKALDGPHDYVIADHGGLLVAMGENKKVIKFSTDEGRCWHEHQYTTEDIKVTGLLTEPGNKAMTVAIWGYNKNDTQWVIHVVDLSQLLSRECDESDYEKWYAHSEMMHPLGENFAGCLLGKKEEFLRLKKDSLCKNGYSHEVTKTEKLCPCTEDDFECEYGYFRTVNSKDCIKNEMIKESLCVKGMVEKIITKGYKKIPSDVCEGGFSPDKTKQKILNQTCNDDDTKKIVVKTDPINTVIHSKMVQNNVSRSPNKIVAISISTVLLIIVILFIAFIIVARRRIIRNRAANLKYKVLAGLKTDDDSPLISNEVGYDSTSPSKILKVNGKGVSEDSDVVRTFMF